MPNDLCPLDPRANLAATNGNRPTSEPLNLLATEGSETSERSEDTLDLPRPPLLKTRLPRCGLAPTELPAGLSTTERSAVW